MCFFIPLWLGYIDYIKMGISPKKLVMGIPWYGYDYICLNISEVITTYLLCSITPLYIFFCFEYVKL